MTEYCKHGIDMQQTCRRCGRVKRVEVPNFGQRQRAFSESINRLEDSVRRLQEEVARGTFAPREIDPPEEPSPEPPAPPPERYPWQR